MTADEMIASLALLPHPEGGFYRETYRSPRMIETPHGQRSESTAIYFLLPRGNFSALHRIQSDEVWHFYAGDPLEIWWIDDAGQPQSFTLSQATPQHIVPAGVWFGSRPTGAFSLVGCTVAPGFDFADFEMGDWDLLLSDFPDAKELILALTR